MTCDVAVLRAPINPIIILHAGSNTGTSARHPRNTPATASRPRAVAPARLYFDEQARPDVVVEQSCNAGDSPALQLRAWLKLEVRVEEMCKGNAFGVLFSILKKLTWRTASTTPLPPKSAKNADEIYVASAA